MLLCQVSLDSPDLLESLATRVLPGQEVFREAQEALDPLDSPAHPEARDSLDQPELPEDLDSAEDKVSLGLQEVLDSEVSKKNLKKFFLDTLLTKMLSSRTLSTEHLSP